MIASSLLAAALISVADVPMLVFNTLSKSCAIFILYYNAIAIATANPADAPDAAIVNVSLPPSLPSVRDTFVPATNLPFKNPGVVSFELTDTLTSVSATMAGDTVTITDVFDFTRVLPTHTPSDSVSVSQNIVLQTTKHVVDSISASDNTYEIGASFEGDGGLFNSATLISSSPPFNEEFVLQTFSN